MAENTRSCNPTHLELHLINIYWTGFRCGCATTTNNNNKTYFPDSVCKMEIPLSLQDCYNYKCSSGYNHYKHVIILTNMAARVIRRQIEMVALDLSLITLDCSATHQSSFYFIFLDIQIFPTRISYYLLFLGLQECHLWRQWHSCKQIGCEKLAFNFSACHSIFFLITVIIVIIVT